MMDVTWPELFLDSKELGFVANMFSVGCIFAKMLKKKPLFPSKEGADDIFKYVDNCKSQDTTTKRRRNINWDTKLVNAVYIF